ncbi:MAG: helix-turn-helix domain-containing protein [Vulcanimicrobiota bacterium]
MNVDSKSTGLPGLATLRAAKGFTQTGLADALDLHRDSIAKYESGLRTPSVKTLRRIATALDCDISDLLSVDKQPEGGEAH